MGKPRSYALCILTLALVPFAPARADDQVGTILEEIVVTAQRRSSDPDDVARSLSVIGAETLGAGLGQTHVQEVLARAPGVNLQRGSGQEYLPALRSPVLTGAGACGALLTAEDGIPITSPGFCNINELFFSHHEAAARIEILRGPGTAVYGGNALHGIVNVIVSEEAGPSLAGIEVGPHGFGRFRLQWNGADRSGVRLTGVHDGGFRDDSGHRQLKVNGYRSGGEGPWEWTAAMAVSGLDQDTAGYITGPNSYRDENTARSNPDPEAFRRAFNARAYARMEYRRDEGLALVVTPYVRYSGMRFRMHFLPGDPFERNGHYGAGMQSAGYFTTGRGLLIAGVDIEYARGRLRQWQEGETAGSAFARAVFPPGGHYDYRVSAGWIAPFAQAQVRIRDEWTANLGVRYERMRYDYRTRLAAGRNRDDSTPCGFGGCRYSRPADRSDSFGTLSPKLSLMWRPASGRRVWLSLSHGFRMPQATELYRLQGEQTTAELGPEQIRAAELGMSLPFGPFTMQLALYRMRKRDVLFRDAQLFNRVGGGTRHEGIEIDFAWGVTAGLALELTGSLARHRYDRDFFLGDVNLKGHDVDTAPRRFGGARLRWAADRRWETELELLWTGGYFLEPENLRRYGGHELLNLRVRAELGTNWTAYLRLLNLTDRAYADRADYTVFSGERYFPGRPRSAYLGVEWRWGPGAGE